MRNRVSARRALEAFARAGRAPVRVLAAVALAMALGAAKAPGPPAIAYTLSPELRDGVLTALDVTLTLRAEAGGTTRLLLPDKSAGATDLWRYVQDLRIEGARAVDQDGPAVRLVRAPPGSRLTVRYRVVSAFDHDPGAKDLEPYKPDIRPRWFWAYGESLFIRPANEAIGAVGFRWSGAPADFPFASSLERGTGQGLSMTDLIESVTVGGPDLTVFRRSAAGAPVRVAVIGRYGFTGEAFADTAARVIAGERAFWNDRERPFLVALAPLTPELTGLSARGEGRAGAFAVQTTTNFGLDGLTTLVGHEYFHTWNADRLGGIDEGEREPASYWFSEGFTEFYARRLLLRMGALSLEQFAGAWNDILREYAASPARAAPGERIVAEFWTSPPLHQLPYQRGAILAAIWQHRLEADGGARGDLDTILRAMRARTRVPGARTPKAPALFIETAGRLGLDVRDDLARIMDRGEPALLPQDAFGHCLQVRTLDVPAFDRGFTVDAGGLVTGLSRESPAYAAGLRDGMRYVKREAGVFNDSRVPYAVRVSDGASERVITFRAEGRGRVTLQEVVVPPDLTPERRAACAAEAAGPLQGLRKR